MTTVQFLVEWALRSSILILSGTLVLWALRVKDPSIRLAVLVAMLFGSLSIPVLTPLLPPLPVSMRHTAATPIFQNPEVASEAVTHFTRGTPQASRAQPKSFDWMRAAALLYSFGAATLLLRLFVGLFLSRRLLHTGRATGLQMEGIEVHESAGVASPVTLGITRPVILLPLDWRQWSEMKRAAVLAHESSHIRRKDPAMQLLAAIHRALTWHSPLSWYLYQNIVRLAEDASDDAALAVAPDRESYAEVLLDFMRRSVRVSNLQGVAMARYGKPAERIGRILDGVSLSRGVTRSGMLAILILVSPFVYLVTAAQTNVAPIAPAAVAQPAAGVSIAEPAEPPIQSASPRVPSAPATPAPPAARRNHSIRRYMIVSGDSMSGSWDSNDREDEQELRQKYGRSFAWFRQGRNEYVVTDAQVMMELEQAMAPQREVNQMQDEVNKHQDVVNQHQDAVNRAQNGVNTLQDGVNRRQQIIDELQSAKGDGELIRRLEAALAELRAKKGETNDQDSVNHEQSKVNQMQARINEEQGKVNAEQAKVNAEQTRVSALLDGRIEGILDSTIGRHLAHELK